MALATKTRDIGIGTIVSLVFYASGLLVIFTPLPVLYVTVVHGRGAGAVISAITSAAVVSVYAVMLNSAAPGFGAGVGISVPGMAMGGFMSPVFLAFAGIGYFVFFAAVGLVLGDAVLRKMSLSKTGAYALAAGLIVIAVMIIGANFFGTEGLAAGFKNYLQQTISGIVAAGETADAGLKADYLRDNAKEIAAFMFGITPSLVFVFAVVVVAVNLLVGRRVIRAHHAFAHVHNVARFKLPDALIWAAVAAGAAFFAARYVLQSGLTETVAVNCLIALGVLYFFQWLEVVVYFLQGIRTPFLRSIAYIMIILFFQSVGLVIAGIGVADVWADFRLRSWRARHERKNLT